MLFQNLEVAGELTVSGETLLGRLKTVPETTSSRTCTSEDYGKLILLSYAGAVTITLPANGAPEGSQIDFLVIGSNSCVPTIAAATHDTLITVNDAQADSVTYATGNRIGACCRVISDGAYWHAMNVSSTTMTVTTA